MAQPYVGEIRMFAGNFAPIGWMYCEGQILPISEYETLFNLIGSSYGGDGQSTFALPDLRGRIPMHMGNGSTLTDTGGVEEVTLSISQIPAHTHAVVASSGTGLLASPADAVFAKHRDHKAFASGTPSQPMTASMVSAVGSSQPHTNMPPYLCVNFIISLFGIYPSPT